jgi:hypothetical protein
MENSDLEEIKNDIQVARAVLKKAIENNDNNQINLTMSYLTSLMDREKRLSETLVGKY